VVFDTSTLVGVALKVSSVPHQALDWALRHCDVRISIATLAELDEVLGRAKFDRFMPREARLALAALLRQGARLVDVPVAAESALTPSCRDLKDNKFLALAQAADVDALICSDADLLSMHPWHGVQIITPALFVAIMSADSGESV
jgi:putative PIN family toxin of toxin-antitoxin system